jgi:hypothetical protein
MRYGAIGCPLSPYTANGNDEWVFLENHARLTEIQSGFIEHPRSTQIDLISVI